MIRTSSRWPGPLRAAGLRWLALPAAVTAIALLAIRRTGTAAPRSEAP
ncbi:hypothetical protein ONA70_25675 [Micromonospora yasonensis]|nr:hypothetical protein [Micromonospora yasonensis]MCW3843499.1 hypothetical protein [Micromonospora yasonensis]